MELGLDTIAAQSKGLVTADMDGEKVMLNIEKGKYFGLNDIGSRIWELLEKPHRVHELVAVLIREYDVDEKVCQDDVLNYISKLYAQGLVDIE